MRGLQVREPGVRGRPDRVVAMVRERAQELFSARLKHDNSLKGGIDITIVTRDGGRVTDVHIVRNSLADAAVVASVVGNLRRATVVGPARQYAFTLEFRCASSPRAQRLSATKTPDACFAELSPAER